MPQVIIPAAISLYTASKTRKAAARQAAQALQERQEQQARVDEEVANYKSMKFTNPYANMENPFEDLKVATGAAEFQAEQGAQQRANILGQLRGAAGSSGIAGLAQTLANQGQLQARQISAGLQKQEVANELMAAKGASMVDTQGRAGEAMVQQAESGRQATILGAQLGQSAGANTNYQQSLLNKKNANIQANQMTMNSMKTLSGLDYGDSGGGGGTNVNSNVGNNMIDPNETFVSNDWNTSTVPG